MGEKFKDRKEQRQVTGTMNALLLPMIYYLNQETTIRVRRALYLLGEIDIESHEVTDSDEGVTTADDVLDKTCADIEQAKNVDFQMFLVKSALSTLVKGEINKGSLGFVTEDEQEISWEEVLQIIDKYRTVEGEEKE